MPPATGYWIRGFLLVFGCLVCSHSSAGIRDDMLLEVSVNTNRALDYARLYNRDDASFTKQLLLGILEQEDNVEPEIYDLLILNARYSGNRDTLSKYTRLAVLATVDEPKDVIDYFRFRQEYESIYLDQVKLYKAALFFFNHLPANGSKYIKLKSYFYICETAGAYKVNELDTLEKYAELYLNASTAQDVYSRSMVLVFASNAFIRLQGEVSLSYYRMVIDTVRQYEFNHAVSSLYINIIRLKSRVKDYKNAKEYSRRGVSVLKRRYDDSYSLQLALLFASSASVDEKLGNLDSALSCLDSVVKYDRNNVLGLSIATNRGNIFLDQNKLSLSRSQYDIVLNRAYKDKDSLRIGLSFVNLANLELVSGNFVESIKYSEKATEMLQYDPYKTKRFLHLYRMRKNCYVQLGDYRSAYEVTVRIAELEEDQSNIKLELANIKYDSDIDLEYNQNQAKLAVLQLNKEQQAGKYLTTVFIATAIIGLLVVLSIVLGYKRKVANSDLRNKRLLLKNELQKNLFKAGEKGFKKKVADDLHDALLSAVNGIHLINEAIIIKSDKYQDSEIEDLTAKQSGIIRQAYTELREYVDMLRSNAAMEQQVNDLNVFLEIEEYARAVLESNKINLDIDYALDLDRVDLPEALQIAVIRVFREVLNNILKHANAESCFIKISWNLKDFLLTISDDGRGMDSVDMNNGRGLQSINDRIQELGGTLRVTSNPGEGTLVAVYFDLEPYL